jgi:hypothetical protein
MIPAPTFASAVGRLCAALFFQAFGKLREIDGTVLFGKRYRRVAVPGPLQRIGALARRRVDRSRAGCLLATAAVLRSRPRPGGGTGRPAKSPETAARGHRSRSCAHRRYPAHRQTGCGPHTSRPAPVATGRCRSIRASCRRGNGLGEGKSRLPAAPAGGWLEVGGHLSPWFWTTSLIPPSSRGAPIANDGRLTATGFWSTAGYSLNHTPSDLRLRGLRRARARVARKRRRGRTRA